MINKNHLIAAMCMIGAVICFAIGDSITKYITGHGIDVIYVITGRCIIGLTTVLLAYFIFRPKLTINLFIGTKVAIRAIVFTVCIFLFAKTLSYSNLSQVYVISLLVPTAVYGIKAMLSALKFKFIEIFLIIVMYILAVAIRLSDTGEDHVEFFNVAGALALATMIFYALYFIASDAVMSPPGKDNKPSIIGTTLAMFSISTVFLLVVVSFGYYKISDDNLSLITDYFWLLTFAGVMSALGVMLGARALKLESSHLVAPYDGTCVVLAMIIEYYYYGQPLKVSQVICACGLIVVGSVFCYFSSSRRK